jgi:hypothetical protein
MRFFLLAALLSRLLAGQSTLPLRDVSLSWNASGLAVAVRTPSPMPADAHVELWLGASADLQMPPIAWGNQFGEADSKSDQCDVSCIAWENGQKIYRTLLPKLFLRRWNLTPTAVTETYATPAFRALTAEQQKRLADLKPSALPQVRFAAQSFDIQVPWAAFPPADRLSLDRIGFQVDVRGGGLALTTLSKGTKLGGLPQVALSPPVVTRLTQCEYPLTARSLYGEERPAYYRLNGRFEASDVFLLENDARGYQYKPEATSLSPGPRTAQFFQQQLSSGEFLCGPAMAYRKGDTIKRFPDLVSPMPDTRLPVKALMDGTRLIQFGTGISYSTFGSGQCGACPIVTLKIFALLPSGNIQEAATLGHRIEADEYEVELSPDWTRIVEYFETDDKWRSVTHCLAGHAYKPCADDPKSPAPRTHAVRDALK